jgi:hypothetical protein
LYAFGGFLLFTFFEQQAKKKGTLDVF